MTINGKPHDLASIDATVRLGITEIWEIASVGIAHPFHIHGASFRVMSINGQSPPAYLMGWKDVVLVEGNAERSKQASHARRMSRMAAMVPEVERRQPVQ
jgi:blue copper oxidase